MLNSIRHRVCHDLLQGRVLTRSSIRSVENAQRPRPDLSKAQNIVRCYASSSTEAAPATQGITLKRSTDTYLTTNVKDLLSLDNRVVVITGGGRGIGLALAFAVAEAGAKVAIIDAADQPHEHYYRLESICSMVKYYQSDVTAYEKLQTTFASIASDFGRMDGL